MNNIVVTEMIPSDYEGDKWDSSDCPGHRAFKRACKENLPWYKRLFINYKWCSYTSSNNKWESIKNDEDVNMVNRTQSGDTITFRKIKKVEWRI